MTRALIILPFLFLLTGFGNPCCKKITKENGKSIFLYYPCCSDSTTYFVRTFEKDILVNELWVSGNRPAGIENSYSNNHQNKIISSYYWGADPRPFNIGYYAGTTKPSSFVQTLSDSTRFIIEFYTNGKVKSYGLTNDSNCNFGIWTEIDSLGLKTHVGKYKIVQREETVVYNDATVITHWCFEKDSVWTTTDDQNNVIEKVLYLNGKQKNYR